ncbi:hypothetical protein ACIQNT_38760 [Streptomyces luteogriseus]|uniref:hypothetical protein n=1 Tax=Streptomyces luteogriseus TaxID=68233 RepID=UPI003823BFAA
MESEVIAALIGAPTVLVTAAAAWIAGRLQSRGAYHGPVDAVRRAAQRDAYADLYRTGRRFIEAWEEAEAAVERAPRAIPPSSDPLVTPDVRRLLDGMFEAQEALEHAADMVRLEGPTSLAEIADRIWASASRLGGQQLGPRWGRTRTRPLFDTYIDSPEHNRERNEAMSEFGDAHRGLLPAAREYLNGGPPA